MILHSTKMKVVLRPGLIATARLSACLLGTASALSMAAGAALAQQAAETPVKQAQAQQAQAGTTTTFDIPAQPLASALTTFGRQAGLQVVFDLRRPPANRRPASAA